MAIEQIDRTDAAPLIPEDVAGEILGDIAADSATMPLMDRLPDMSRAQRRLKMWTSVPVAYFVAGDTGQKKTTAVSWDNVYLNAEELAVIVPVDDNTFDDVDHDIWETVRPGIVSAFGKAFDQAVMYGINAPASWPECIVEQCDATGHTLAVGDSGGDLYDDLLGEDGLLALIEEDGFMATGHVSAIKMRAKYRGLRDDDGQPVFATNRNGAEPTQYTLDGEELVFPKNGSIDPARSLLISGDWSQAKYAIRKDMTFEMFREGVIQNTDGSIALNLMQQDSKALRVTFRLGWALPNPINLINEDDSTRFPFAMYEPVAAS